MTLELRIKIISWVRLIVHWPSFLYSMFSPKQNDFVVLSGHESDSFASFLNGVILQKTTQ